MRVKGEISGRDVCQRIESLGLHTCQVVETSDRPPPPWIYAFDPVNVNPCDISGRGIILRWEFDSGTHVHICQFLEQFSRAALGDVRPAVDDRVFGQTVVALCGRLERMHHARVAFDVTDLLVPRQVRRDDLIVLTQPQPRSLPSKAYKS